MRDVDYDPGRVRHPEGAEAGHPAQAQPERDGALEVAGLLYLEQVRAPRGQRAREQVVAAAVVPAGQVERDPYALGAEQRDRTARRVGDDPGHVADVVARGGEAGADDEPVERGVATGIDVRQLR